MVPVPVHASRRRRRGFNQAEELARRLSEKLGIPVDSHILIRTKKTVPQKNLNPAERLRNLEQAFSVASLPPRDKTILLIDDIYTTGATAEACAKILKEAGAEKVYVFTIFTGSGN
jgi:ComF family protein